MAMEKQNEKKKLIKGYIALALGVICLSLSPILVKSKEAPTMVTSFYRMFLTAAVLTVLMLFRHRSGQTVQLSRKFLIFPLLAGIFSGFDHSFWSISLVETSTANATVLNDMGTVWISLAALIFLKEKFSGKFWAGLALSLFGTILMSGKGMNLFAEGFNEGDKIALFSSLFCGGYFLFTQLGRRHFDTMTQMWISNIACSALLFVFCRAMGYSIFGYGRAAWLNFFATALVCQLGGYFLLTYALGTLPASIVSPTDQFHTVLSALIAIPVFGESLSSGQVIGMLAICVGLYLINIGKLPKEELSTAEGGKEAKEIAE